MKKFLWSAFGVVAIVAIGWAGINYMADVVLATTIGG